MVKLRNQALPTKDNKLEQLRDATEKSELEDLLLIDFGFAVQNLNDDLLRNICGTPNYMAPEIFQR